MLHWRAKPIIPIVSLVCFAFLGQLMEKMRRGIGRTGVIICSAIVDDFHDIPCFDFDVRLPIVEGIFENDVLLVGYGVQQHIIVMQNDVRESVG